MNMRKIKKQCKQFLQGFKKIRNDVLEHSARKPLSFMKPVYCGSLAPVHSHKPASLSVSRVCRVFLVTAHSVFLAQVCKRRLASVVPTLRTVLARVGAITSLAIGAVGNCLAVLLPSYPSLWFRRAKAHHVLSQESVVVGRVFAESQKPLKVSGQKLPVKAPLSSSTLPYASRSESGGLEAHSPTWRA